MWFYGAKIGCKKMAKISIFLPKNRGLAFLRRQNSFEVFSWAMGVFWGLPALVTHKR